MSLSNSRLAYTDCYTLLDQAMEEPRGIRVAVPTLNAANYLRMRLHHARTIDRRENRATYPEPDHPLHDRSPYDILVVRIDGDDAEGVLFLDKLKVDILSVEPIPTDQRIDYKAPLMIEGPKAVERETMPGPEPAPMGIRRR